MIEENIVIGAEGSFPLKGKLTLPDAVDGKVPAIVLVHGSGSTDMNETVARNAPFRDIAEYLPGKGVAVLRYDKRTFAYKKETKQLSPDITVRFETIEDAILASKLLKSDPRIGPVYIAGHSMGGMLAPRIDAEGGAFDGLIILAGTPRTLWEVIQDQYNNAIASYKGLTRKIIKKQFESLSNKMKDLHTISDEEAKSRKIAGGVNSYYFKEMEEHPFKDYLDSMKKPILILQGEEDFQVFADKDFRDFQILLKDYPDVTFKKYPRLNHIFMPAVNGTVKDYKIPSKVDQQVLDDISRWIFK